jgi:hypothetical protein
MAMPWEQEEQKPAEEKPVPQPQEDKKPMTISQTLIKKLIDKNQEDVECCPFQIYHQFFAPKKLRSMPTIPMRYGSYGESLMLGANATDEEYTMPSLLNGKKPIDMQRVESQALELWPIHQTKLGISIVKNMNTQVPIYVQYGAFVIRGVLDLFPTPIFLDGELKFAVVDIKFTGDVDSTHGDYCWGKPEWMDHIQADLYSWMLGTIDVDFCKKMDKEFDVRVGYDTIFTPTVKKLLKEKKFTFVYCILGYKKQDLKNQFLVVERNFWNAADKMLKDKELSERLRKTIARIGYLNSIKWKPNPHYSRCQSCPVAKTFGGPCEYEKQTRTL